MITIRKLHGMVSFKITVVASVDQLEGLGVLVTFGFAGFQHW